MDLHSPDRRRKAVSIAVTAVLLIVALWGIARLLRYYQDDPWTRDGRIRADVIQIAPDVGGLVTAVHFDHDQRVRKGDVLFEIDSARYAIALQEAQVGLQTAQADMTSARFAVAKAQASLAEARREATRNVGLGELLPSESTQQSQAKVSELEAALGEARAQVEQAAARVNAARVAEGLARLNLQRTRVIAPTDGYMSDVKLRVGNYVSAGEAAMVLVDTATLRVEGYFEESKLPNVKLGQKALVHVMGESAPMYGHVVSIAAGINDHDRSDSGDMLPKINPSFSWVRLPQRVPVRIHIDRAPRGLALISGRTVSVSLMQGRGQ